MHCPKCQFENREGAKFCNECGHKLEPICPNCEATNRAGSKYCDECGSKLSLSIKKASKDLSFDEKLTKIQKYLPKGLTDKILSQRDRIEGERKQVTVMFCDMVGFTPLTESLGIEDAYSVMDRVYETLIHKVHDYEGTVNEMTGDGIMALFGAPVALEDAPLRAIRSSLAIHREISKLSEKLDLERADISGLKMRVGINTGPVVVGTLGNDLRVEFKAVGDTVNLASRMEAMALPGATYITEETFRFIKGLFRFEALGQKEIKGKTKPVKVFRVIAPSTRRTRFDVSAERGLTPFVGRERELALLLEGFERFKIGRGQVFSIISEAGVGKSRLLYEFRKAVTDTDVLFLEGRCMSYSRGTPYYPIIDLLKANFDIRETDNEPTIIEKVKKSLTELGTDKTTTLPYLLELLSVKRSGSIESEFSPEARKNRIIEAVKKISLLGSEIRPVIMAFEDLHWIDKNSEQTLKHLLDGIGGSKIFLIFSYRPDYIPAWGGKSYHSQLTLNRLSNRESLSMVSYLLKAEEIEIDLKELILEKTEGIPFFVEEFTRSLKDLKIIDKIDNQYELVKGISSVTIPSTIQDVIMARIDSLPENAKEILQIGSVIGREFSYILIKHSTTCAEKELLSCLSILKDSELLYERGIYPQSTCIFKHALTQEVVYDSLLVKRKKQIHAMVGNIIEDIYKENPDEYYGLLVEHFIQSENHKKAAKYSRLAAKSAQKAALFKDAIEYAQKTIHCLERLPSDENIQKKIIDARTLLAGYFLSLDHYVDAKKAVTSVTNLALELNYKKRLPIIYTALGTYSLWVEEDYLTALKNLRKALKISEEIDDQTSLWYANFFLGITVSLGCEFENGLEFFRQSLTIGKRSNKPIMINFAKGLMSTFNYIFCGKAEHAYQISRESMHTAQESGDIYLMGMAYCSYGIACFCKGFFKESKKHLTQALSYCEEASLLGWETWGIGFLACAYTELGDTEKAKEKFYEGIAITEKARLFPFWTNMWMLSIARLKVLTEDANINQHEILEIYRNIKIKVVKGWATRYVGEIIFGIDKQSLSEAEKWVLIALEGDRNNGTLWSLAGDYAFYAKLLKHKGEDGKAKSMLYEAIEIYKECGADGWIEKTEQELVVLK